MLFAHMAGGKWVGVRGFKMFCQRGSGFFLLALCVCMCVCVCAGGGGGAGQVQYLSFLEKITEPFLLINGWSL